MIHVQLSDELKKLFEEQFLKPANDLFESGKIGNPNAYDSDSAEAIAIRGEHRKTLINFGRGDFKKPVKGLTPALLVDLYCYYYFQMHFSSSYAFYFQEKELLLSSIKNKIVIFIDIGSGPGTSGLAFNQFLINFAAKPIDGFYIAIDSSKAMRDKVLSAAWCNLYFYIPKEDKNSLFDSCGIPEEYFNHAVVILNFSYIFGSDTLTVPDMVDYTNKVISHFRTPENEKTFRCIILQQNPDYESLNKKWYEYKSQLTGFKSAKGYPQLLYFSFDDLFGNFGAAVPEFNVKCDVLMLG